MLETFRVTPQSYYQGIAYHQSPKVLTIFDLEQIDPFYNAWGAVCTEMVKLLDLKNDTKFYTILSRSRNNAVSTKGYFDGPTSDPSPIFNTMDLGNFMETFYDDCNPIGNHLETLLAEANATYYDMIVHFGVGPETKQAFTGLGAVWPTRKAVHADPNYYKELFDPKHPFYSNEIDRRGV